MTTEFERRIAIIRALEETGDEAELHRLVQEDRFLESYHSVLTRAACHLKDAALVRKLLALPVLDQSSRLYRQTVGHVFSYMAANRNENNNPAVIALLYDRIKDDEGVKNASLAFVFATVVSHGASHPD